MAFSKLTRTVKAARTSLNENENQALLTYHEVAEIFDALKNYEKFGHCMNNIGCLYLRKQQFANAWFHFKQAI